MGAKTPKARVKALLNGSAIGQNIDGFTRRSNDAPMNRSLFSVGLPQSWPLLVLLLIAAVWFHRTPYSASNLEVPPDTVEYALAPLQFLETGRYEIIVEGRGLPPRYPPWFPVLVILPAYVLFGHEPGNAILPITLLAVTGVGFAYAIGKRISSTAGGVLAALGVLILPSYSRWATQVMIDVPCAALVLGTCLVYLHLRTRPQSVLIYFGAGVLLAITTLFRPVFAAMLLPFVFATLRQRKGLFLRGLLLLAPMTAAATATFAYNAATFGSPLRNGYKFWVAVPMDYPTMIFSLSYLRMNLGEIGVSVFPILLLICIGAWLLARKRRPAAFAAAQRSFQDAAVFLVLTTVPMLLFHLFYFYPDDRFHIPMLAGTAVLAGSMLALLLGPGKETIFKLLLPAVLLLAVAARIAVPATVPLRRLAAERVRKNTPENAIVISTIDPVYLARLAGHGSSRRIVPLSRNVEYASALLVRKRVDDPRLRSLRWDDDRARALIRPHAEEAVRFVASERMDELVTEVARGTPVFFESSFADENEAKVLAELQAHFKLVQRVPYLYQLQSR
jgi:4-amino-4-deoxy-L-arabinose transferase-like glycosyltransferase